MADIATPLGYNSDTQSRYGGAAVISLPDLSETKSTKVQRKLSQSSGKKKVKKSKTK